MNAPNSFLTNLIQELRTYSQQDVQPMWHGRFEDMGGGLAAAMDHGTQWEVLTLNDRQHIAWAQGRVLYLYQRFTVPADLNGYPLDGLTLRLATAWWAEDAQLYVNGEFVQAGDLFDFFTRLCLSEAVFVGQSFEVVLRLESPKHDAGALVRSQLIYEAPNHPISPEPGFVADELQVLQYYLQALAPEKLAVVNALITSTWQSQVPAQLHPALANLRQALMPYGDWLKQRRIHCVGHAHLDLAWLWPVADTWRAAERTFQSVLSLQQEFPELTYTHSSPALFAWLETHRPELFHQVQHQVAKGRWSIDAGLWVEPELNIASGEAIARQILYGQRYCQEKFGAYSAIAWLPDTFGFCSQLPQLLRLGGVDIFATQKLRWNDTTQFPHELFCWQAPDGSQILGWTLPPIGTDFDPVQMAEYGAQWEAKTGTTHVCWLPGVGDHGGGPTRDMLLKARRWHGSPFFPTVTFSSPNEFLNSALTALDAPSSCATTAGSMAVNALDNLPVWQDELYLELHRGCYTAHSDQKQQNRRGEDLLYQAEVWATVALVIANCPYPKEKLETAWKTLLFNQFHDILPGSSIPDVFEDANREWATLQNLGQEVMETALGAISAQVTWPDQGQFVLVFNPHSWSRTDVVNISIPPGRWQVFDAETDQPLEAVLAHKERPFEPEAPAVSALSFVAQEVPAIGYRVYYLREVERPMASSPGVMTNIKDCVLQNDELRVVISKHTGDIISCVHRLTDKEIFNAPAHQLQCFQDSGQYWDAWNIAPDYQSHPCAPAKLLAIDWCEHNAIRQRLRVTRRLNLSTIVQDYTLEAHSPLLKIETWVDWHETQVVLKVNFPLTVSADRATYEVPFGAIERSTKPSTPHEQAKWEVPALRWADLSDETFGVSILTDCKHGFDTQPNQLRLTLLKAPLWPDPGCDRGYHHFTYAIYPHVGTWQTGHTPRYAQALNIPLMPYQGARSSQLENSESKPRLQRWPKRSFLSLSADNLVLAAFKPSELDPKRLIARYYDAYGQICQEQSSAINNSLGLTPGPALNLLEESIMTSAARPYQIHTCCLYREEENT